MALQPKDLFFVNRNAATYKIEADEIGEFLLTSPKPDGTYYVNDGELNITNNGNPDFKGPFLLVSANTHINRVIDFDDHFAVTKVGSDVHLTINMMTLKESLVCDDNSGTGVGFLDNKCDCLALDIEWISEHLPCGNNGIINDDGCLSLNICDNSVIHIDGDCIDFKFCDGLQSLGGCLTVDLEHLSSNLICPGSGLTSGINDACIGMDYNTVLQQLPLHKITAGDHVVLPFGGDLRTTDVRINVDFSEIYTYIDQLTLDWSRIDNKPDLCTSPCAQQMLPNPCDCCEQPFDSGWQPGGGNVNNPYDTLLALIENLNARIEELESA